MEQRVRNETRKWAFNDLTFKSVFVFERTVLHFTLEVKTGIGVICTSAVFQTSAVSYTSGSQIAFLYRMIGVGSTLHSLPLT